MDRRRPLPLPLLVAALALGAAAHVLRPGGAPLSHFTHACALQARCVPRVQCPAAVRAPPPGPADCALPSGADGLCCASGQNHTERSRGAGPLSAEPAQLAEALRAARGRADALLAAAAAGPQLQPHTAPLAHSHSVSSAPDSETEHSAAARAALQAVLATRHLADRRGLAARELSLARGPAAAGPELACPPPPACDPLARFRRADGACNNPARPRWGSAGSPHARLLPPRYSDGLWEPRVSARAGGAPLPPARRVSAALFPDADSPHPHASLLVMQFGQVLAHDLTLSPAFRREGGGGVRCCAPDGSGPLPAAAAHFACLPLELPEDDPFYARFGQRCMNLVRTQLAARDGCALGFAQQMNAVTHYLDASAVYGASEAQTLGLRELRGGRLRAEAGAERAQPQPPLTRDPAHCAAVRPADACFLSGDPRTNQMVGLVVSHQLLLREHNSLAAALHAVNPRWSDERLFQEARRVVAAQLQHITYSEFLPVLLGEPAMLDYRLWPLAGTEHSFDYDPAVEPATTAEFAAAAFRFGHSTVDGLLKLQRRDGSTEYVFLPDVLFNASRARDPAFSDRLLRWLAGSPLQRADSFFTRGLTNFMFHGGRPFGLDLASLNVQRGRDHGLPTYDDMRQLQGLAPARRFADFLDRIAPREVEQLERVYADPRDVDLFVGGLLETAAPGALLGPTFLGVAADQFSRLRRGDRFFYDLGGQPHSFSPGQLREVRTARMARLLCDRRDGAALPAVSPQPFLQPDTPGNDPRPCELLNLPQMDLSYWKEEDSEM